jgi:hypothetical protein
LTEFTLPTNQLQNAPYFRQAAQIIS